MVLLLLTYKSSLINPPFHFKSHTFACLSLDLGVDLYVVSKLLGHRSIAVTQIYGKISDTEKTNAVNQFNGIFNIK